MGSSNGFQSLFALNTKFSLFSVRPKWVWHSNISVTPSDFRPLIYPFVFYTTLAGESFLSLGLEQLWLNLDPFRSLALRFGIVFHLQLVLLSYHPIFLRPCRFLKLVFFRVANRTKSASVCSKLLRSTI